MRALVVLFMCFVTALCFYDELAHRSETCEKGEPMRYCIFTPCMIETKCKNYPFAECSNNLCKGSPCSTVWRFNGEIVDCGNYEVEDWYYDF